MRKKKSLLLTLVVSGVALTVSGTVSQARAQEEKAGAAQEKKAGAQEKKPGTKGAKGAAPAQFAGSDACQKCHAVEFKSWKETFHSRMIRPRDVGILKDAVAKWSTDGANPGPTTGNVTGKKFSLLDVRYVIGSRWKQRYLVKDESTGGFQFLNKQFNRSSGQWEPYGNKNDWDTMCATCHTTGYQLASYEPSKPAETKGEWVEMGVGCEACHGPGAKHARTKKKADIWNPASQPPKVQARLCGYCHIRVENEMFKSAQGNPREDLPAPKVGETFRPWDDWTKWYPEHVVMPGIQPEDKFDTDYAGDLKGMFKLDEIAKSSGVFEETKHHQEYQGFIQSAHYQKADMSCITCHSPHAGKGTIKKVPKDACQSCHDASFTVDTYMPNTGKTAENLFVKSHTFKKDPRPSSGPGAPGKPPEYYE